MSTTSTQQQVLLPGQQISVRAPAPQLGTGTYSRDAQIRASLLGAPKLQGSTLTIPQVRPHPPAPNSVVLGSVTRLSPLQAFLSITVVDGIPLPAGEEFTGVIRSQDVRATEKDRVKIGDCFRGGDVVRGVVISLGDARSYFITTARNDLGVIYATSEAGATLEPVSWQEMRCPKTGKIEKRKCAKPENM
ncbi:exoribonuclease [Coprinopsis cinerea AmutBmut pab1-1]|nr:exoribonuclease [Coprinopsis cinerea AmutBmut pab1-1]